MRTKLKETRIKSKELELGTRKVSKMNFSHIVTLPKLFIRNSPYGEIKLVRMIMLEDGSLKIIPVHEKATDFTVM